MTTSRVEFVPAEGERVPFHGLPGTVQRVEISVMVKLDNSEPGSLTVATPRDVTCLHSYGMGDSCPNCDARTDRCEAYARKGTGTGMCDRPLDRHGNCDRAADHIEAPS